MQVVKIDSAVNARWLNGIDSAVNASGSPSPANGARLNGID